MLLAVMTLTAVAQQTVTPPADAVYYDYVLTGVANWPSNPSEDLQDAVYVAVAGNDVYVSGLCGFLPDAWVKGTRDGSTVTFAKGQYFGNDTQYGAGRLYFLGMDESNTAVDVVFSFDEMTGVYTTSTWVLVSDGPADTNPFYYISNTTLTPGKVITDEPVEAPEGLATKDYELTGTKMWYDDDLNFRTEEVSRYARVGFRGSEVYVQGLCEQLPYSWVKGTVSGDDATFAKGQFYGVYSDQAGSYPLYFGGNYFGDDFCDMQWDYASATGVFSRVTSYMVLNSEKNALAPYEKYANAKLSPMANVALTPADPQVVEFQPYLEQLGAGYVRFDIPRSAVNGKAMIPSKLFYTVWSDVGGVEQPLTLTPQEYAGLTESTTEIPYEQYNGESIFLGGSFLMLYGWMQDFDRIGIQSVYYGGGEQRKSAVSWYTIDKTAIATVSATAPVVGETYYDLQGRQVGADAKGLLIRKTTCADGTTRTVKVVR